MKHLLVITSILAIAFGSFAADFSSQTNTLDTGKWIASITASPFGAIQTANITGQSTFGAGIDLGINVNRVASIHATALAYDSGGWRGSAVDESEFYGRANFLRFAEDKLLLYGKGGAARAWSDDIWGFGVGAGAEYRFSDNIGVAADYTVRAWFKEREKDAIIRAMLTLSF